MSGVVVNLRKGQGQAGPRVDWTLVRAQYESTADSVRAIAEAHGVSHTAINRRVADEGWRRKPGAIRRELAERLAANPMDSTPKLSTETTEQIKERALDNCEAIVRKQAARVERHLTQNDALLAELTRTIEALTAGGRTIEPHELQKLATGADKVSSSLYRLVQMQRVAYGIDEGEGPSSGDDPKREVDRDVARRLAFLLSRAAEKRRCEESAA